MFRRAFKYKETEINQKLLELKKRFQGALKFLRKTNIKQDGKVTHLNDLPWYLLLGPKEAGKTSVLLQAGVNFVLQKHLQKGLLRSSTHCDFWVTRQGTFIDVPGYYLAPTFLPIEKETKAVWWQFLLNLIKNERGKEGIAGLIFVLPVSFFFPMDEATREAEKKDQLVLSHLFQRIAELRALFTGDIACHLVMTKCDELPGFLDFFAEYDEDEVKQAFSISLPTLTGTEKILPIFNEQFDMLVKKVNQQLIFRLHQERDPLKRLAIKDFPIHIERLRERLFDFTKKFYTYHGDFFLRGIFFSSALQPLNSQEPLPMHAGVTPLHAHAAMKKGLQGEPRAKSRSYFLHQVIKESIVGLSAATFQRDNKKRLFKMLAYAFSVVFVVGAGLFLWKGFLLGMHKTESVADQFIQYQTMMAARQTPEEAFLHTLTFLEVLKNESVSKKSFSLDFSHLFSFYQDEASKKVYLMYETILQHILTKQMAEVLSEYLVLPVNKNADVLYAVLKSYLMLNDVEHFDAAYMANALKNILPTHLSEADERALSNELQTLQQKSFFMTVNDQIIADTRHYFTAMQPFQLAYIILLNNRDYFMSTPFSVGQQLNSAFIFNGQMPANMFTAEVFPTIFNNELAVASKEAIEGNWVIGNHLNVNSLLYDSLLVQLKTQYLNNYVNAWETFLAGSKIRAPKSLKNTDELILSLTSADSPLLNYLSMVYANTYFVTAYSPRLQSVDELADKKNTNATAQLYQVFQALYGVHQAIANILQAKNSQEVEFNMVKEAMQHREGDPDAFLALRDMAGKMPAPISDWLNTIADTAWHFIAQDAQRYIDISANQQRISSPLQLAHADINATGQKPLPYCPPS